MFPARLLHRITRTVDATVRQPQQETLPVNRDVHPTLGCFGLPPSSDMHRTLVSVFEHAKEENCESLSVLATGARWQNSSPT